MQAATWNDATLDALRQTGDGRADETVSALLASGGDALLMATLHALVANDDVVPETLAPPALAYFQETEGLPDWTDSNRIALGESLFLDYPGELGAILACASLPMCYADANLCEALYLSSQLTAFTHRRIIETMQFVFDVLTPGGLAPSGKGIRAAQKIRLLHATMRHVLLNHPALKPDGAAERKPWDQAAWGIPLNQEDLALTLNTFSLTVLDGFDRLGTPVPQAQREAYHHCWRVIGHLLGIVDELNPPTLNESRALYDTIQRRQFRGTLENHAVTLALVDFVEQVIPRRIADDFGAALMRHLLRREVSEMLAIPRPLWTTVLIKPVMLFFRLVHVCHRFAPAHCLIDVVNRHLLLALQAVYRSENKPMFHIPDALQTKLRLPAAPDQQLDTHARGVRPTPTP